jgi:hypothetical protein
LTRRKARKTLTRRIQSANLMIGKSAPHQKFLHHVWVGPHWILTM